MWEGIDSLLERAPHVRALRFHRLELLEARRRRTAGIDVGAELAADEALAVTSDLAVPVLLARARAAWDGRLVVVKGPEVSLDYPGPRLRRFRDLDLLTDDAAATQSALLAAGFREVGDPEPYRDIHHLRPLWWPGLPLVIELHSRPKWPELVPSPATGELLEAAVPGRLGIDGVGALPPAHHALLLAAHAWAHEPLERVGHLLDVAATLRRTEDSEVAALARRWGCSRLWRTTRAAARAIVDGERSAAVGLWARHLTGARERTVLETHLQAWTAPVWGLPRRRVPRAVGAVMVEEARRKRGEPWRTKAARARLALTNARVARHEHDVALEARERTETW